MTSHSFTSHGFDFIVEGTGFMHAGDDFATIAERIETALDGMPAADIARLHAGAMAESDGADAMALDDIAGRIKSKVTRNWHNANGANVSLIAVAA